MPKGGSRSGGAGKQYANRTDLNTVKALPVQAATGQSYGAAGAQMAAQKAVPMGTPMAPPQMNGPAPGELGGLLDPSTRPSEPITAGLPLGPGPGPEVLPQASDDVANQLRAIYSRFPTEELRQLIEQIDEQ